GGAPRVEVMPDERENPGDPSVTDKLRKVSVAATDVLHHERREFAAAVTAWLGANRKDTLVKRFEKAATHADAVEIISKLGAPDVAPLMTAVKSVVGRRSLDDGARSAIVRLLWQLIDAKRAADEA